MRWTRQQDDLVVELWRDGHNSFRIARKVGDGCSAAAVRRRLRRIGVGPLSKSELCLRRRLRDYEPAGAP